METINELFEGQIKDLHNAESQLVKALPKMAKRASNAKLKKGFETHLKQTETHVERLEKIAKMWEFKPTGKKCKAMEGLIKEGQEAIEENGDKNVVDCGLIAAAQRVEHYEMSAYESARALAERLGCSETAGLLQRSFEEESETNDTLRAISEGEVLMAAPIEQEIDGGEETALNESRL